MAATNVIPIPAPARPASERWPALVAAVQRLAGARSAEDVIEIVRTSARAISAADGVTFVVKDEDKCHYVEEDAVGPLWKGRKFPLTACISGWCMLNDKMAVIPDIYVDPRIPHDAYRPTFVKSLVMTPVRTTEPVAAIGCYWSMQREFDYDELALLEALGRSVSTAMAAITARQAERKSEEHRARLQSELAHLGRMNELGQMASSIAHELNQPLTAAHNYLGAARRMVGRDPDKATETIGKADAQVDRIKDIIQRIRGFAGKQTSASAPVPVAVLIDEPLQILKMDPRFRGTDIAVAPMDGVGEADVDRVQIQQVVLNLVRNALEAMETSAERRVNIAARRDAGMIEISVADTGPGLAPEVAARLFQPFVTTKDGGMGVGLSICRAIVEAHGGKMRATPREGGGTVFAFTLPVA